MSSIWYCSILFRVYNKIVVSHSRHLSISCNQLGVNTSLSKQGKIFNKLLGGSSKKKRKHYFDNSHIPSTEGKLNLGHNIRYNKENSRRVAVLNSIFMRHISDLLVTGNIGVDVLSKGLEISRVSMAPNFDHLNVFWGTNNENNITELENLLPGVGFKLRHELSQLRVMGVVPRVVFVKDKQYNVGAKVDYLLSVADFGEDHEPLELESDFKHDPSDPGIVEKSDSVGGEEGANEDVEVMPAMRQDTFNLNHQLIMDKILRKIKKSKAYHRFEPNLAIKSDGSSDSYLDTSVDEMAKEERKEAMAKFILSRRIIQEKKNKNLEIKRDYVLQDGNYEDDETENFEVEDYIEEEDYEEKMHKN